MSSEGNDIDGTDTSRFRASPDTVYNDIGNQSVLIHMKTNKIFELNRTGARFWELLCSGQDLGTIRETMLREFDVSEAELDHETKTLLGALQAEGLVNRTS